MCNGVRRSRISVGYFFPRPLEASLSPLPPLHIHRGLCMAMATWAAVREYTTMSHLSLFPSAVSWRFTGGMSSRSVSVAIGYFQPRGLGVSVAGPSLSYQPVNFTLHIPPTLHIHSYTTNQGVEPMPRR